MSHPPICNDCICTRFNPKLPMQKLYLLHLFNSFSLTRNFNINQAHESQRTRKKLTVQEKIKQSKAKASADTSQSMIFMNIKGFFPPQKQIF